MAVARTYESAIKCLNALQTNYSTIQEIHKQWAQGKPPRDPELIPEMKEWVRRIGYKPEDLDRLRPIHVTGTKGKGSIGLYTSPHLKSVRERIMINGQPISAAKFAKYFFDVYEKLENTESDTVRFPRLGKNAKPMYFKFLTLVSFHAFMQERVHNAIYEVGIGGEYDSTNIFVHPTACGITSLGLDHTAVLGNTVSEIAWNKSGIFKPGSPAYTVDSQPVDALRVIRERASERGVSAFHEVSVHPDLRGRKLGLKGHFQEKNASLACYLAAEALGLSIDPQRPLPDKFLEGVTRASWPGRCQVLKTSKAKWFLDGAHTKESLEVAVEWLAETADPSQPVSLLFNQQKRDNVKDLLKGLHESLKARGITVSKAYFSTNQSFDAGFQDDMISLNVSQDAVANLTVQNELASVWRSLDPSCEIHVLPTLEQVAERAEGQVFATGSLLMIGGLLAVID